MMFSMTTLAVAWLLPIAIAAPSGNVQNVDIIIQQIDATSELDIAVVSKKTSQVLGYACSNTLNSGAFSDLPITATLDRNGAGSLAVGDKTYMVHEDPKISGGITCARIYNEAESFTVCSMQVPASLPFTPISDGDMEKCFDSGEIPSLKRAYKSILAQQEGHAMTNVTRKNESPSPHKRDPYGMCDNYDTTWMVGDGNPHQNYLDTQLSENMGCGAAPSCTVGETESVSYTIGFSATATVDEWLTGGFDVSVSWTTGNTYSCTGASGDTVCVWYNTAHTAYTVENVEYYCGGPEPPGPPFVLFSPNSDNVGGGYYCVVGTCRSQGSQYWDYSGPAGGPQ